MVTITQPDQGITGATEGTVTVGGHSSEQPEQAVATAARVHVVTTGERIDTQDCTMWLTTAGEVLISPAAPRRGSGASTIKLRSDSVPAGAIKAVTLGDSPARMLIGLYHGPGQLGRVTVRSGGTAMDARIMTLAGTPGWAAFYTERLPAATSPAGMPVKAAGHAAVDVVGYAVDGTVLGRWHHPRRRGGDAEPTTDNLAGS
ncbi:hypothetical protein ABZ192_42115 [Streptomyces sp. NPDC006235]|uniref:hypothetical protein n=1 Tax=Streptomyces sp. NPDC006235 TaxID=3156736 RepID=UPI0033A0F970